MSDHKKEAFLAFVLLVTATAWTVMVVMTIPPGMGNGDIGPRAFPLGFGVILLALAAVLVLKAWAGLPGADDELVVKGRKISRTLPIHLGPAIVLLVEVMLYGFLLEKVGFLIATPIVMLLVMSINFRVRSPRRLFGMAIGFTFGCWLVFGKLLGIYLAAGQWINLG